MSDRSPITACSATSGGVLDRAALDAIRALDENGAAGLLRQVLHLYFESSPRLIAELRRARAAGDTVAVRNAAHSLKSSSANLGATSLADMCKAVEHAARAGSCLDGLPSADEIEREFEAVQRLLQQQAGKAAA